MPDTGPSYPPNERGTSLFDALPSCCCQKAERTRRNLIQTGPPPGDAERLNGRLSPESVCPQEEGFSVVMSFFEVALPAQHGSPSAGWIA
jgi:hypothetical protein